jgi:hypothetical protein
MNTIAKRMFAVVLTCVMAFGLFTLTNTHNTYAASNKTSVYKNLRKLGYSKAGAAGIMANIKYESSYNPRAGGVCYGLVQWTGSRKSNLRRYCARKGYSTSSVKGQVAFLDHELKTSYRGLYRSLKSAKSAYKAGYRFCYDFERPAARSAQSSRRGSYASRLVRSL